MRTSNLGAAFAMRSIVSASHSTTQTDASTRFGTLSRNIDLESESNRRQVRFGAQNLVAVLERFGCERCDIILNSFNDPEITRSDPTHIDSRMSRSSNGQWRTNSATASPLVSRFANFNSLRDLKSLLSMQFRMLLSRTSGDPWKSNSKVSTRFEMAKLSHLGMTWKWCR